MVLRLYRHQNGQAVPVGRARPGELYTYTVGPAADVRAGPGDLRCYLVSDLIRRAAERHRLRVTAWQNVPGGPGGPGGQSLHATCDALNIYPAAYSACAPDPLDIGIGPAGEDAPGGGPAAHWVRAAEVLTGACPAAHTAQLAARGMDPLALRLAFLQAHYRQPVTLGWDALTAADESLRGWRRDVAGWARSPSRPMSAAHVAEVTAAFDDDLATPAALAVLRGLAHDDAVAPGAKFETFAYLDRLLGLDLVREVGR